MQYAVIQHLPGRPRIMSAHVPIAIVGTGIAAVQAAAALRKSGYGEGLILIGAEKHLPYNRPPLSKEVLQKRLPPARIVLRPESFYSSNRIELRSGAPASRIDRQAQRVELTDGGRIGYAKLLLATGSTPSPLPALPIGSPDVYYLRSLDDALALRERLTSDCRLGIVGGGVIGLEVAATAIKAGCQVFVIEAASRVMGRAACPELSDFVANRHRAAGVDLRCGVTLQRVARCTTGWLLTLSSGETLQADAVLVGIGVRPCTALARESGLAVSDHGILTDEWGRTDDPNIHAAGEVAHHVNVFRGRRERQENWLHAAAHGELVGRALTGTVPGYNEPSGYWTDQYDLSIQSAGLPRAEQNVVRGDPGAAKFIIYHLEQGVVVGATAVNAMSDFKLAKELIKAQRRIAPERLADPGEDLGSGAQAQ
jgi:3-phenylpropionate/trans-cinnamate dioxygenase ferredoxin reductase component